MIAQTKMTPPPPPIAKSGVEWIPIAAILFSLLSFLFLLGRKAINDGKFGYAFGLLVFFFLSVALVVLVFVKELWILEDHCEIRRGYLRSPVKIPFDRVIKAKYSPHVFRSGPTLVLYYYDESGSKTRKRFGLRDNPEQFVSLLRNRGISIELV